MYQFGDYQKVWRLREAFGTIKSPEGVEALRMVFGLDKANEFLDAVSKADIAAMLKMIDLEKVIK